MYGRLMIRKGDDVTTGWLEDDRCREVGLIHNIYIRSHDGVLGSYVWTMYKYVDPYWIGNTSIHTSTIETLSM